MAGLSALLQGKAEVEEHCPDDAEDVAEMADIASKSWLDLATEALSSAEGIERGFLLLQRGGVHAMLLMGEKAQEDLRDALKELEEDPEGQTMAATLLAAVLDGEGRDREAKRLRRRYKIAED